MAHPADEHVRELQRQLGDIRSAAFRRRRSLPAPRLTVLKEFEQ